MKTRVTGRRGPRFGNWFYVAECDTCEWRVRSLGLSWGSAMRVAESHYWLYSNQPSHGRRRK